MSNSTADNRVERRRSVSWLDKLNARVLFAVTPEYTDVVSARGPTYGKHPTFAHPAPMPLQSKRINGVEVRYAHQGESQNPTVILLNPLPQSIVAFAPIWDRLASRFNLYAYDLPGFGRSEGGEEFMTFERQGRFLQEFIAAFEIQQPHIVGPDIGMAAALAYVTHFPNDVASLAIGDGPGIAPSQNGSIINKIVDSSFWRLIFRIAGAGTFVHAGNEMCYLNYAPNPEEISDYIRSYRGRIGPITTWFKKYPESLAYVDPMLSQLDKPVLVFWGAQDKLLLVDNAQQLHQRLPRSRVHIFDQCGHYAYQDQHEAFGTVITEWVENGNQTI